MNTHTRIVAQHVQLNMQPRSPDQMSNGLWNRATSKPRKHVRRDHLIIDLWRVEGGFVCLDSKLGCARGVRFHGVESPAAACPATAPRRKHRLAPWILQPEWWRSIMEKQGGWIKYDDYAGVCRYAVADEATHFIDTLFMKCHSVPSRLGVTQHDSTYARWGVLGWLV